MLIRRNYPLWSPRFWHGFRLGDWLRLLGRNRFQVHPIRLSLAGTVTVCSLFNSLAAAAQWLLFERRLAEATLPQPPIFILGHWRSGTTLVHELLALDDRFMAPSTYQCFVPHHFLVSEWLVPRLLWFILPGRRPMDRVRVGWQRPQEDEFALCSLGLPSPYLRMAFPNRAAPDLEYLTLENLTREELQHWQQGLLRFLRLLTLRDPRAEKQLVLKSPTHTGRIGYLAEMFPECKFVHLTRDPESLFASTMLIWERLDAAQGLQIPHYRGLQEHVLEVFERMYSAFERQRQAIGSGRICDIRYEDLIADPVAALETVYAQLELGEFAAVRDRVRDYVAGSGEYQPNRHDPLTPELAAEVRRRWAPYLARYGHT